MSKNRIINIEHMLKSAFLQGKGCDFIKVVMGRYKEDPDKSNTICFMYCKNGDSDKNTVNIKTTIPNLADIVELVGYCLMKSGLRFEYMKGSNMDGSDIDIENLGTDMMLTVDMK